MSDALLKLVREEHVSQAQMMLISGIGGTLVILFYSAACGQIRRLQPHKWGGLFAIGLAQFVAYIAWISALPFLPLTSMYSVAFLTPMTVACLATLLLKEPLGWKRAIPIGTGFCGVVVAMNPASLIHNSGTWFPYLMVFVSMTGSASQMLLLRAVGHKESGECMAFYPRFVLLAAGAFGCATTGFSEMKPWVFIALLVSGAFGSLGWVLMSHAYKNASATAVAPFHYSQMIIGAIFGFLIWRDVPSGSLVLGAVIIVASGIYLVRHERRVSRMMVRTE